MEKNKKTELKEGREVKMLLEWESASRPFKKRSKEYFQTILAIVFLVSVVLLFLKEWFLIAAIWTLVFVYYSLARTEPEKIKHQITTKGMVSDKHSYKWENLRSFWFGEKYGQRILLVETKLGFPRRLILLVRKDDEVKIEKAMTRYLDFEEEEPVFLDKAAGWLAKKVPLEESS